MRLFFCVCVCVCKAIRADAIIREGCIDLLYFNMLASVLEILVDEQ